eukprot:Sspe_Gene.45913::Locus_22803_Transcript_1_1_Confidence_1.000_Length_1322::g.45913::m.45913
MRVRNRVSRGGVEKTPSDSFLVFTILPVFAVLAAASASFFVRGIPTASLTPDGPLDEFMAWFVARGGQMNMVNVVWTGTPKGNAVVATRNINAHEEIMRVPMALVLTSSHARQQGVCSTLPPDFHVPPRVALALQLLHERSLGDKSVYSGWLPVLPSSAGVFSMGDDDRDCFSAPVHKEIEQALREVAEVTHLAHRLLGNVTEEEARWAHAMVASRGTLLSPREVALVPGMDLFNHAPRHRGGLPHQYLTAVRPGAAVVSVTATEMIPYAAEVYLDYHSSLHLGDHVVLAPRSPDETFVRYGFVDESFEAVRAWWTPSSFEAVECRPDHLFFHRNGTASIGLLRCVAAEAVATHTVRLWGEVDDALSRLLNGTIPIADSGELSKAVNETIKGAVREHITAVPAPASPLCARASSAVLRLNLL